MHPVLEKRRLAKFKRDNIDIQRAKIVCNKSMKEFECLYLTKNQIVEEKIINNVKDVSHHFPIVIDNESTISNDFKQLCPKGQHLYQHR